ncbi:MAG: long-chain N-acyl amino acid synthase [Pseudomonadota bacterium]
MEIDRKGAAVATNTIIGIPFETAHALQSLLSERGEFEAEAAMGARLFKIRAADSSGRRSSASILINKMYATRGYLTNPLPDVAESNRITLMAVDNDVTIGTISIGFDGPEGLLADDLFKREIDPLRMAGRRLCEFTKLAVDNVARSKRVLASLFHVAFIYAHRIRGHDSLLIEVNPRHVRYYERLLGSTVMGPERLNPRVNAPAVLLHLDFAYVQEQISKFGGKSDLSASMSSLYPYAFSIAEEAGIVGRMHTTN